MIQRNDILSIPFLKKSPFTGSYQGMRYRLERLAGEDETEGLLVHIWEGPYSFDATSKDQCSSREFSFDESGICQSIQWLNACWSQEEERWRRALSNW